jgi:hypothetical protein
MRRTSSWLSFAAVVLRLPAVLSSRHLSFDDGVYGATAVAMRHGARPYRDVFSSQGPLHHPLLYVADLVGGRTQDAPRLLSLAAAVVITIAVYLIAAAVGRTPAGPSRPRSRRPAARLPRDHRDQRRRCRDRVRGRPRWRSRSRTESGRRRRARWRGAARGRGVLGEAARRAGRGAGRARAAGAPPQRATSVAAAVVAVAVPLVLAGVWGTRGYGTSRCATTTRRAATPSASASGA